MAIRHDDFDPAEAELVELNCGKDHLVMPRPKSHGTIESTRVHDSHEFQLIGGVYVCVKHPKRP